MVAMSVVSASPPEQNSLCAIARWLAGRERNVRCRGPSPQCLGEEILELKPFWLLAAGMTQAVIQRANFFCCVQNVGFELGWDRASSKGRKTLAAGHSGRSARSNPAAGVPFSKGRRGPVRSPDDQVSAVRTWS